MTEDHVPAPHETHIELEVAPGFEDQEPALQPVHIENPWREKVPALQIMHPEAEVAPAVEDQVPASQFVQK